MKNDVIGGHCYSKIFKKSNLMSFFRGEMYMFLRDAIIGPKNEEDLKESIHVSP